MKPTKFAQANGTLLGGPAQHYGTKADVKDLPVYRGGGEIISCWRPSFADRLRILFKGHIWLRVAAATTHAPVAIDSRAIFAS